MHWAITTHRTNTKAGNTLPTITCLLLFLLPLLGCEGNSQSPGFALSPTSGLTTTENGAAADFDIVLNAKPDAMVTVTMRSSNTNEGALSKDQVSFTSADWSMPQTISIVGVDDNVLDGDAIYHIDFTSVKSNDRRYNNKSIASLTVLNLDNEVSQNPPKPNAGVTVAPSGVLVTSEDKTTATFSLQLTSKPASAVTITAASSNTNEGVVTPLSFIITPNNWNTATMFTVTGVDDAIADGTVHYRVTLSAQSSDPSYNGISLPSIPLDNVDNDVPGITINATTPLETSENLTSTTFTVVLNSAPSADVTIAIESSDTTEGTVTPAKLTFTPNNWNTAQTVTVRGIDDSEVDGDVGYDIGVTVQSTDAFYNGMALMPLAAINRDNDTNAPTQYNLYIEPGTFTIAASTITGNGATTFPILGFASASGSPGVTPGPLIETVTGQTVTINVTNDHANTHRFTVEGLLSSVTELLPGDSKQIQFTPTEAGVYRYGDPQLPDRSLGLYGAVVVRPVNDPNSAWTGGPAFTQERTWVISDFDDTWQRASGAINTSTYNPNYFVLNGKSGFAASQDATSVIDGNIGDTFLIRIANAGQYDQSLQFHSHHAQIISQGGRKLASIADARSTETINVKRGSTAMVLLTLNKPGTYPVTAHTAQMQTGNGVYLNGVGTNITGR